MCAACFMSEPAETPRSQSPSSTQGYPEQNPVNQAGAVFIDSGPKRKKRTPAFETVCLFGKKSSRPNMKTIRNQRDERTVAGGKREKQKKKKENRGRKVGKGGSAPIGDRSTGPLSLGTFQPMLSLGSRRPKIKKTNRGPSVYCIQIPNLAPSRSPILDTREYLGDPPADGVKTRWTRQASLGSSNLCRPAHTSQKIRSAYDRRSEPLSGQLLKAGSNGTSKQNGGGME